MTSRINKTKTVMMEIVIILFVAILLQRRVSIHLSKHAVGRLYLRAMPLRVLTLRST